MRYSIYFFLKEFSAGFQCGEEKDYFSARDLLRSISLKEALRLAPHKMRYVAMLHILGVEEMHCLWTYPGPSTRTA